METDKKTNELRAAIQQMLIDSIPKIIETLHKLPPDKSAKYYFRLASLVRWRSEKATILK